MWLITTNIWEILIKKFLLYPAPIRYYSLTGGLRFCNRVNDGERVKEQPPMPGERVKEQPPMPGEWAKAQPPMPYSKKPLQKNAGERRKNCGGHMPQELSSARLCTALPAQMTSQCSRRYCSRAGVIDSELPNSEKVDSALVYPAESVLSEGVRNR